MSGRDRGSATDSRRAGGEPRCRLFLSHLASEAELASGIKRSIEEPFLGQVEVFSSSDPTSLSAGDRWLESVSMQLKQCDVQLILLGPAALTRPWIYFEAGAVWSQDGKPQIPICHSGLQLARLPIPLSLLQGGLLTDASFWQSVFKTIAKAAESRVPKVDFQGLSDALAVLASRVTQATSTTRPQDALARFAGPELRALSPDRQRLEQDLYGAILRYTTLRAQHRAADPSLIERASNASGLFWGNPTSFSDQEVARALDTLNAAIAALDRVDLRLEVLRELRDISRRQARTSVILGFDIAEVTNRLGLEGELVQDTLTDVLGEGLAEPYAATFGQSAEEGACRITQAGMRELRRLGAAP